MGAVYFQVKVKAKTARDAYDIACQRDAYEHGHSYSGGPATTDGYVVFPRPDRVRASTVQKAVDAACSLAWMLQDDTQRNQVARLEARYDAFPLRRMAARFKDKWGKAGVISLGNNGEWIVFGLGAC